MSYKTGRLVDLFPPAYAASERESLLYKLLDAVGAEFMQADETIKRLLKSHWVDYAEGAGLDGLAATFGVARRRLSGGQLESDEPLRRRLKAIVPLFAGGGTRRAIVGAVRSALGLPFDLDALNLPAEFAGLRRDLDNLITIEEFSPKGERLLGRDVLEVDREGVLASQVTIPVDIASVQQASPTVRWRFMQGGARELALVVTPDDVNLPAVGVRSLEPLVFAPGQTLVLTAVAEGRLSAALGFTELAGQFVNLDGSAPALLPEVPAGRSEWSFRARSGLFDISPFGAPDESFETFDLPLYEVEMSWQSPKPLTFDVHVPYFLQQAVADLAAFHRYTGSLFVFEGLPLEALADVVDQTRAAGVQGSVQFSLNFLETHTAREALSLLDMHAVAEDAGARESFTVASANDLSERHDVGELLIIGGLFDIAPFDQGHGFIE